MVHCIDVPCDGAHYESGKGLDKCEAIHAEINAITHCDNPKTIHTAYCTMSPCKFCLDALLSTTCQRIVFLEEYPHTESKARWENAGRLWEKFNSLHQDKPGI